MRQLKPFIQRLLIIACALHLSGAHWAVLQVTAWTGMLISRSQASGLIEAIETTFDGDHPCPLCSAIESGQKGEERKDSDAPMLKTLFETKLVALENAALPAPAAAGEFLWPSDARMAPPREAEPPTPPPRVA